MERKKTIRHFRDLEVYQRSFALVIDIFQISKKFRPVEKPHFPAERCLFSLSGGDGMRLEVIQLLDPVFQRS